MLVFRFFLRAFSSFFDCKAHSRRQSIEKLLSVFLLLVINGTYAQSSHLDSLRLKAKQEKGQGKITYLLELAEHYGSLEIRNVDSMGYYANEILKIDDKIRTQENDIDAQYILCFAKVYEENYDVAIELFEVLLHRAERIDYAAGLRKANYGLGFTYFKKNENLKGLQYFEKAYELAQKNKESENIILDLMVDLCLEYIKVNDFERTSELLEKSIAVIDDSTVPAKTRCLFYLNAALFNYELDNYETSLEQFNIALKIARKIENNRLQMAALLNISNIYTIRPLRNYEKSISFNLQALDIIEKDSVLKKLHKGVTLFYLGYSYYWSKDYEKAVPTLEKSFDLSETYDGGSYAASILKHLGYAYYKTNRFKESDIALKKASKLLIELIAKTKTDGNSKREISDYYMDLAEIDSTQGNFKKSLTHYKLSTAYRDSLNTETNLKITERLDFVKQTAEKDKEIAQLTSENEMQRLEAKQQLILEISLAIGFVLLAILLGVVYSRFRMKKKALKIIKEKNEENKLLMREIHHRVKNNLQIILGLLGAQQDQSAHNEELSEALIESQKKIRSMAIIHQNLYRGNNFVKVSVNSYLEELIGHIKDSFERDNTKIVFDLDVTSKEIKMGLAVPLGLILNELVTNCYKYAFADENNGINKVWISFQQIQDSGKFRLMIKDNGRGLPDNFDFENLTSFGMQLVHGLVEQLNGKIEILEEKGTGFEVYLKEPLAA